MEVVRPKEGAPRHRGLGGGSGDGVCRREGPGRQGSWAGLDTFLLPWPPQEPRAPAQLRPLQPGATLKDPPHPTITPIALIRGVKTSQVLPGNSLISTHC